MLMHFVSTTLNFVPLVYNGIEWENVRGDANFWAQLYVYTKHNYNFVKFQAAIIFLMMSLYHLLILVVEAKYHIVIRMYEMNMEIVIFLE